VSTDRRRLAGLIAILGGSGVLHFVAPRGYEKIVPPRLGDPASLVRQSGAAELACAAMLAMPNTRRLGGWASAALFVAVFPANVYTLKVLAPSRPKQAAALARLPLQWPMIAAAMKVARGAQPGRRVTRS
jgi:uncharacterized membrane protein